MNKLILIYFFIIVNMFTSCTKDKAIETTSRKEYYLADYFKPLMFKTGSYWVYKDDTTQVLDSVSVTSTEQGFYYQPIAHDTGFYVEYYQINLHDFLSSTNYFDYLSNYFIRRNGGGTYTEGGQPILWFSGSIGWSVDGAAITDSIAQLNLNGNLFNNIVKMKITAANQRVHVFPYDTYLYFADSVGIIKMETDSGNGGYKSVSLKRWQANL